MSQLYAYEGLVEISDIRILELYSGNGDSPLQGRLKTISLETKHTYEALSYAWESDQKCCCIELESGSAAITLSLYTSLRRLRRNTSRFIWADALCIDQQSNDEKSHQVQMMSRIYQNAQQVIIFLGDGGEDGSIVSDQAFKLLRAIRDAKFGAQWRHISDAEYAAQNLPVPMSPDWQTYSAMLELPWFTRLWVIQECVVAQKATLVWNKNEIDFGDFLAALLNKNSCGIGPTAENQSPLVTKAFVRLMFISSLKDAWAKGTKRPLARLLSTMDHAKATIPHDNMFALLGLAQESEVLDLQPNYDEPLESTLLRYARHLIVLRNSLEILSSSGLSQREYPSDAPSWVPLWTSSRRESNLALCQPEGTNFFHASDFSEPKLTTKNNSRILGISGYVFDTLSIVKNSRWSEEFHDQEAFSKYMFETFRDADDAFASTTGSTSLSTSAEALWRNLLVGKVYESNRHVVAPAEYGPSFRAFRKYLGYLSQNSWNNKNLPNEIERFRSDGEIFYADFWTTRYLGICATDENRIGRIPRGSQVGDVVAIFVGAATPFVLREDENHHGMYQLIGECYIHGSMHGEVLKLPEFQLSTVFLK